MRLGMLYRELQHIAGPISVAIIVMHQVDWE